MYHCKESDPVFFTPSHQYLFTFIKIPFERGFFKAIQTQPLQLLFTHQIIFKVLDWTPSSTCITFSYWGAQCHTYYSRCLLTNAEYSEMITSLNLVVLIFLVQPWYCSPYLLQGNAGSCSHQAWCPRDPQNNFCKVIFHLVALQPVEVSLDGSTNVWYINYYFQFFFFHKLAESAFCPSSRSLIRLLNYIGPSTDLWSTPLLTGVLTFCHF